MISWRTGLAPWHMPKKWAVDFTEFSGNLELKGNTIEALGAVPVGGPHLKFTYKFCIFLKIMKENIKLYPTSVLSVLMPTLALGQLHKAEMGRN